MLLYNHSKGNQASKRKEKNMKDIEKALKELEKALKSNDSVSRISVTLTFTN